MKKFIKPEQKYAVSFQTSTVEGDSFSGNLDYSLTCVLMIYCVSLLCDKIAFNNYAINITINNQLINQSIFNNYTMFSELFFFFSFVELMMQISNYVFPDSHIFNQQYDEQILN